MQKETTIWYLSLTWRQKGAVSKWLESVKLPKDWKWSRLDYAYLEMPLYLLKK